MGRAMILEIPLQQVPNQTLTTTLNGKDYEIELNTRLDRLYISIIVDGVPVVYNRICQDDNPLSANLLIVDVNANRNPVYSGLSLDYRLLFVS